MTTERYDTCTGTRMSLSRRYSRVPANIVQRQIHAVVRAITCGSNTHKYDRARDAGGDSIGAGTNFAESCARDRTGSSTEHYYRHHHHHYPPHHRIIEVNARCNSRHTISTDLVTPFLSRHVRY